MLVLKTISVFVIAGLCEIGGGYLIWQWLREHKPSWFGLLGGVILVLYGIVATFQPAHFGRVYAAYGGVYVVVAVLWLWAVDGVTPDRWDLLGGTVALAGMMIIMFSPR